MLNNLKGWIGGATAVVLALAGLSQAVMTLMPAKTPEPQALAEDADNSTDETATADAAPEALPLVYDTSDGGTLYFKDGMWTLYDEKAEMDLSYEMLSRDDGKTVVANHERTVFLRWPNEGGMAEQSVDNRVSWSELAFLSVPEPEATPG